MNEHTNPTTPDPAAPRRLTKSSDRKVAGVASGIAEYFAIDPTIVRLIFLASVFLGGFGLIAYVIAWIVLPADDGSSRSGAPHTVASTSSTVVAVGLLIAGAIIAAATVDFPFGGGVFVALALVGAGAFLLLQGPGGGVGGAGSTRSAPPEGSPRAPGTALAVPEPASPPAVVGPGDGDVAASGDDTTTMATFSWAEDAPVSADVAPHPHDAPPLGASPAPPVPTPPITALVLSAIAVIGAGGFLVDAAGWADVSPTVVVALCLGAIGIGLIAGAVWGGGGGLIPLGVFTTLVLLVVAVASPAFEDGVGERDFVPVAFDDVPSEYRHGIGDLAIDLTAVEFPAGTHELNVHLGIGQVVVTVPDGVDVVVDGSLDIGELEVFDLTQDGMGNDIATRYDGDPDDEVTLVLDVDAGIGHAVVRADVGAR